MNRYGSDKPDLRFGLEITELTAYFADTPFRVFQAPYVGAVVQRGGAATPRRGFDAWQEWAKQRGAKGLAYVTVARRWQLSVARWPRTSPTTSGPGWPPRSVRSPATRCSSPPAPASTRRNCSAPPGWRSAAGTG